MEKYFPMKNIFKIHILYYVVAMIAILTGFFRDFILISFIIFIHEMGHITMAIYYKWNIEKIVILPFGGITIFHEQLNRPIKEEFLISIFGPIYQILFYLFVCLLNWNTELFMNYHYALLLFNLLPIIPLDGSKIIGLIFQKFLPYYHANKVSFILSIFTLISCSIYWIFQKNFIMLLILFFLCIENIKQFKKISYIFHKFLLERYLYSYSFSKRIQISGNQFTRMRRDYKHLFLVQNQYKTEKEMLRNLFLNETNSIRLRY